MRFRQVHLDFHTSEAIPGIGKDFSKAQFQSMLRAGHVDSITVFSKCHHGWAYHPSEANEIHPHLEFDLLGEMIEAAHEIGVRTPVYLSAGLDEKLARRHPEWLIRDAEDRTRWVKDFMTPGYHEFCLGTPYLDILLAQLHEVVSRYDADGIFLDIVGARKCRCQYCVAALLAEGKDPRDEDAVVCLGEQTYLNYARRVRETIDAVKPGLPVYHNNGHQQRGRRDLVHVNTHLELESLPTGGWGYDHFPLSARYAQPLGLEFLGMTGKFHTSWGEFGGYKHPNALRYEAALSLAHGAKCSIGDQLHPSGLMDEATYALIGAAYAEVEEKEPWCSGVTSVADIAVLSLEAAREACPGGQALKGARNQADAGAVRILTEGHYLYDIVDTDSDWSAYKVLVLPDEVPVWPELGAAIAAFTAAGGKVLATGRSGLNPAGDAFALELGVSWLGTNTYRPSYFHPHFTPGALQPASFVMYGEGQLVELSGGNTLGHLENPYFNRDVFTFCSHQHTPGAREDNGPAMVENDSGIYIAWDVFSEYADGGHLILKEMVLYALSRLLPQPVLSTSLPARGIATLQYQQAERRYVNHLLYAAPALKGRIEVIEDIVPLQDVSVSLRLPSAAAVKRVYLAPAMSELPFTADQDGGITYTVPHLENHQMAVIELA
ncbi:beta-galactosidase trimerization domain-containing protein [Paenibacillus sp. FSL R7-0331]|uniref:beta-galactosidase trimerization domain-containing protein n=1 Tax=Paenibacillus sp. FSL R7-0331 TaxID=1536773 RepID=UPI0004F926D3|nr:beta-galactosidase trimerization domain-containing protein [Paenibacillus sp. FSL R7-0331]AIQ54369.1 beta-galactosidase [Paenibacillus sp. FSL R7-0331]